MKYLLTHEQVESLLGTAHLGGVQGWPLNRAIDAIMEALAQHSYPGINSKEQAKHD